MFVFMVEKRDVQYKQGSVYQLVPSAASIIAWKICLQQ